MLIQRFTLCCAEQTQLELEAHSCIRAECWNPQLVVELYTPAFVLNAEQEP